MAKSHNVKLTITNKSGVDLNFAGEWFDSGRVADGYSWPKVIKNGDHETILCYEKDGALAGCSGYCIYKVNGGTELTIAFSNPSAGSNKLGAGTGSAKKVWDDMDNHDYKPFVVEFSANGNNYYANCKCTGSSVNDATVSISPR
ncbi:MAG: hypothetical protein R2800_03745 [Flavipsychrobacter sp.]